MHRVRAVHMQRRVHAAQNTHSARTVHKTDCTAHGLEPLSTVTVTRRLKALVCDTSSIGSGEFWIEKSSCVYKITREIVLMSGNRGVFNVVTLLWVCQNFMQ